ncbi:hypothetical protein ACJIZ3_013228 [Penstemon smallii]|uniref:Protein NUCLEAR FUSION DEFECTIVE 6, chloroplastic/mitochondrial-like n=1 Tax=Penstemon smallii TaxID=265156 RepID=A0ABD3UP91_9LAMI
MATFAARSVLRSARGATARVSTGMKPGAAPSSFRISSEKPISARIFRSPVGLRSVSVVSMLPYHTATASALLNSMISVATRSHAWTIEGNFRKGAFSVLVSLTLLIRQGKKGIDEGRQNEIASCWNFDLRYFSIGFRLFNARTAILRQV